MRQLRAFLHRLTGLIRRDARERELQDELESHFQLHIDDNIRAGMSPEDARRAAILKFGPVESIKEAVRDRASIPLLEILIQDVRYALRRMRRQPGFTALIALTLALGVGANAAMFGLVDALLFRTPAHVQQPGALVVLENVGSYPRHQKLTERLQSLDLAAFTFPQTMSLGVGPSAHPVTAQCVSTTFFDVLGVHAHRGRTFVASDLAPATRPVLLSHGYWSRYFGADPTIVGTTLLISRQLHTVVGVTPKGFTGVGGVAAEAWTLLGANGEACLGIGGADLLRAEEAGWLTTIGRPRAGLTPEQAAAELASIEAGREPFVTSDGETIDTRAKLSPMYPGRRPSLTREGQLALWLAGGASLLLLLACANIAGLLSMRAVDRRREVAIRLQLGGSRRRVFGQLLAEHLIVVALGAAIAVLVAGWLAAAFGSFVSVPADTDLLDARMLAIVAALAVLAGLASGVLPALQATRSRIVAHLRTGHGVAADGMRVRGLLLTTQLALALMLVACTGLFVRSVERFRADFAYDIERVVSVTLDPGAMDEPPAALFDTFERLRAAAERLPAVERAALTSGDFGFGGSSTSTFIGRPGSARSDPHELVSVTPGYFAALGLRITRGRAFTEQDARSRRPPVILNEALVHELFGAEDPIGQCVVVGRTCHDVVGIAGAFRATPLAWRGAGTQAFLPLALSDTDLAPGILVVRTRGNASEHLAVLTAALQGASPDLPFLTVQPLTELVDLQARSWLLGARAFGLFGALAVVLAAVGIYGALAFAIRQRTVEIGVRMAFGAMPRDIVRLVLRYGAGVVAAGLVLGTAGAIVASRYAESMLFNVRAADPATFVVAAVVVAAAALLGCLAPAVRAARVDPAEALRTE
jgi:putative ABC transport system permease protein